MVVFMYFADYHNKYLSTFAAIVIHEISHIVVSVAQGRKLYCIRIFIIGISAIFYEDYYKDTNFFLIYIAGPISNLLISLVCVLINTYYLTKSDNIHFFILTNVFLALFNLLPVLPLDGGKILRDILISKMGLFKAHKYSKSMSRGLGLLIILTGIIQLHDNMYNFSLLFLGGYIFYCLKYDESEVYFMNIKNLVYKRSRFLKKGIYPGRELVVIKSMRLGDVVKNMDFDRIHIIYVLDENMRLVKVFTEQEIIDGMEKFNGEISFEELINLTK